MDGTVGQLLGGPRGRRLCLELAMEMDRDIRIAVFHLGFNLDPGAGRSRRLLTMDPSGEAPPPPPEPTAAELKALLMSLDLNGITTELVQKALERAVDTARYWQEPDGEDVLAAAPEMTSALSHVAEGVLGTPAAESWTSGAQVRQWNIDWRSPEDPAPLSSNPRQKLAEWARNQRAGEVRAAWERPADIRAQVGGEWWSIPHNLMQSTGQIPQGLDLVEDSLGWENTTAIPVAGTGRILEIYTAEDWTEVCRQFPLEVTASRRHDWFRTTGRDGHWVIPDWERVSSRWDAVHLTVAGYLRLAGRALDVDPSEGTASVIAGWNPDTTFWLNDVVREAEEPRQHWHREHNQDEWELVSGA